MQRIGTRLAVSAALSLGLFLGARPSSALDIGVSITVEPPALPVYEQPEIPGPGYLWTPGYWAWGDDGYYWVPGTWVEPPEPGLLWTPGYWGWGSGAYLWHDGYWGPQIGFYGGINYGFGYFGHGYDGGYWDHGAFRYNSRYNHFGSGAHITNFYDRRVVNNITVNHVSFNGGRGIQARADSREIAAEHEHHVGPIGEQRQHIESARGNPQLRASENHGHPGIAATARPGDFQNHVIPAHGAPQFGAPQFHGNAPGEHSPAPPTPAGRPPEHGFTPENRPANNSPRPELQQHAPPQAQFQPHEPPHQQEQHAPPQAQFQPHEPPHQQEQHAPPQAQFQPHEPPHQQVQHAPPQAQAQPHEPPHQQEQHAPPQAQAQQHEAPHPQASPQERRDDNRH